MRAIAWPVVFMTVLAGLLALPGTASARSAGDNAFLIEYASTVEGLVGQVDDSRLLVLRYAKFYKADPSTVITYFRNELSIEELTEDIEVDVYHRKGTDFEGVLTKFKKGTKVFVNRNGIPILQLGSGNPMLDSLPGSDVKKLPNKPENGTQPTTPPNGTQAVTNPPPTTTTPPPTTTTAPPVEIANNQLPTTVPGAATSPLGAPVEPVSAVLASGPIETITRGGSGIGRLAGWILPIGLAGAALMGAGGGGGNPPNTPDPVPEPGGILALGTGVVSLASMAYHRRIRRR